MQSSDRSNAKRIAAGLLCLFMLLSLLVSAFLLASESDHDCVGEDCPICAFMEACANSLRQIGMGILLLTAAIVPGLVFFFAATLLTSGAARETPVSKKVRLNN